MKPQTRHILNVLAFDRMPHSALEFKDGVHGMRIDAVSQRVGELVRLGYGIKSTGRGGHTPATYQLVSEPGRIPSVDTYGGALFALEEVGATSAARA